MVTEKLISGYRRMVQRIQGTEFITDDEALKRLM